MNNYQETGNQVPVTVDELKESINIKLAEFDSQPNKDGLQNPYIDDIIHQTKNGKTVKVPKNIQLDVVNDWVENKKQALSGQNQDQNQYPFSGTPNDIPMQKIGLSEEDKMELLKQQYLNECNDEESGGIFGSLFFKILILVIIMVAIYYYVNK